MTFEKIRNEYERQREEQRRMFADFLSRHDGIRNVGLRVVRGGRAGTGRPDYSSGGRIENYDLRNWKWVEVKNNDDFDCIISLNMLDCDPRTENIHALYDRVGFVFSANPKDWLCTDIDLPFNEEKMESIARLVLEQYRIRSVNN